jgi:glucose/arabinose dehydrogenase
MNFRLALAALLLSTPLFFGAGCKNKALTKVEDPRLADLKLPQGFHISLFADSVDGARSMTIGTNGTVFVGSKGTGKVYALADKDGDGQAETRYTLAEGLSQPNGVAFRDGALFVAEAHRIIRFDDIENRLASPPAPAVVSTAFPDQDSHSWKYMAFGPDGKLYVPVGAPCNNCNDAEKDPRFASITRMNPDGSGFEVFASGIRNTVGFDWHPQTHELWFTDNGRDELGDDVPGDELNRAPAAGLHFGYPYCHAGTIPDPDYGTRPCSEFQKPVQVLAPHTAALGMKFYTGSSFPQAYRGAIFIAEHGSWNRSTPIGYRVMMVRLNGNNAVSYEPFITGWLKNGEAWGRPVDVLQLKDGSILISDDFADCVYRVTYSS